MGEDKAGVEEMNLAIGHLTGSEITSILKQWYENQSGLQSMHLLQEKELSRIHLANELKIIEAKERLER